MARTKRTLRHQTSDMNLRHSFAGRAASPVGKRQAMPEEVESVTLSRKVQEELLQSIADRSAKICVIGLGYVGLPLAVEFARAGLRVTGIDVSPQRCEAINASQSYIRDVPSELVAELVERGNLRATTDYSAVAEANAAIICVPTPLGKSKDPDISYIINAAEQTADYMHQGMLLVLESTTYPGTTEEILLPLVAHNGFRVGEDFFLAFSPERVDPGNKSYSTHNTPKVVGGMTPACLEVVSALYSVAVQTVVPVSSPRAAEMCKILENTFRAINIGLANEMAQICHRLDIDVWEVIEAAATKPFGFMPFYPGPGLGGHCIPIDPLYLTWKMRAMGMQTRFIELADVINTSMPHYVVSRIQDALNEDSKALKGSHILILGVAYKKDVDDVRESPALSIIHELQTRGADVAYHDPYVAQLALEEEGILQSVDLTSEALQAADCVLVHTPHSTYDWQWVGDQARLVVDAKNVMGKFAPRCRVAKL